MGLDYVVDDAGRYWLATEREKLAYFVGHSLPLDGDFGNIAGDYLDRSLNFARLMGLDAETVLGYAMAHEIGHLLLGSNSHASQGIMRPTWDQRDIHLAKTGVLGFTTSQARRMQEQVLNRLESARGRK